MSEKEQHQNLPVPVDVHPYIDSVAIWTEKKPENNILKSLKELCGKRHVNQKPAWWDENLRCRLHLHQPKIEALQLLEDLVTSSGISFLINWVDLALDFIVRDGHEAHLLNEFLDRHLLKRWHGKQKMRYVNGTRYTGQSGAGHKIVNYCGKPSRFTGDPCVHLEWRAHGKKAVESLDIYDLQHLIEFDHRGFWSSRLVLEEINFQMLGRQLLRRGRAKIVVPKYFGHGLGYPDYDLRVGSLIRRVAATRDNGPTAQDLYDYCRGCSWFRPKTSMKKIDIEPYLPSSSTVSLWSST